MSCVLAGGGLLYPTLPPPLIGLRFHQFSLDLLCAGLPGHSGPDTWGTWGTAVSSHHHGDTAAVAVCDHGDDCWVPGGHWPGCWVLGAGCWARQTANYCDDDGQGCWRSPGAPTAVH